MQKDEWRGIKSGWAYKGKTYEKGAPIFFISTSQKRLNNFVRDLLKVYEMETEDQDEYSFNLQAVYDHYSDIEVVYPYDRINQIEEKLPSGTIVFSIEFPLKEGKWEKEYIKVSPSKMKRFPGYVYG
jgi:hypothetical protein